MLTPKRYLRLEWENVSRALQETLRYRYSKKDVTEHFYNECSTRLEQLCDLIGKVRDGDQSGLFELWRQLVRLSILITNIEHSHLEEFSWPFAEALKNVTSAAFSNVLFLFKAEGGLCSYAMYPESPGVGRKRIFPVVFPRGIREFVLLHTIIGHEFGHAALVSHGGTLGNVVRTLISGSVLELTPSGRATLTKPDDFFQWCKAHLGVTERVDDESLSALALGWAKELFCDLFGLLIMGPSFLPAFQTLLETPSFNSDSMRFVPSHPPFALRTVALLSAVRALNLLYSEQSPPADLNQLTAELDKAFVATASKWDRGPFSILQTKRIQEAADELVKFATPPLAFPQPDAEMVSQLMQSLRDEVPPVGAYPATTTASHGVEAPTIELVECTTVDFRHVLLAGWLSWAEAMGTRDEECFRNINRLCAHAIMQQEGISYWKARPARTA
ncbi:MAG: hypothetical protein QOF71_3382 [Candidatus Eremiobacteraeota bacterium]|jgi:hypothetical protein|nr:hypothetical protein [Candidatus Eremiobacteraeota bacterium]